MRCLINFFLCLFPFCFFAQTPDSDFANKFQNQSSALINECITYEEVVGLSAGIYMDGKVVWTDAVGYRDMEKHVPATVDMVHRIASISKPMTAIAIMQLVEGGLIHIDDPIQKYIPEYPIKKEGTITIKHLLQHSSGIKAYKNKKEAFPTKNYFTLRKAVEVFEGRDLANIPGKGYQYTTYGYVVLGEIIEKVSGISYRDYMKKNIWDKAGMTDTDVEIFGKTYPRKSKLYTKNKKGNFVSDKSTNLSVKVPGGGIQSSVPDLLKFAEAVIEHKLISEATHELMITSSGLKENGNPYGMGWFIYADTDANKPYGRMIGHSGSQSGTATQLFIFVEKRAAVAVISNTGSAWNNIFSLTDRLCDAMVRPEDVNKPLKEIHTISNQILDYYIGKYTLESGEKIVLSRKNNKLYGRINGSDNYRLFPESDTQFFLRFGGIELEFESSSEKAKELTLIQFGNRHVARR